MKITIDLRSLSSGTISGVENYILHLLDHIFALDSTNQYTLFSNSYSKRVLGDFRYINTSVNYSRYPSKLLNLALKYNFINLNKIVGDTDILFLPNLNQFNVDPKTKVILTVHDISPVITPEFYNLKRKFWHKFLNYKKAYDRANIIIAVSESTKKALVDTFKIDANKIKVIYPGISTEFFNHNTSNEQMRQARNIYNLPGEYILFLNTIEPRKNLSNLITAFENIESNCYLVIAGKLGWKYRQIFKQIKNSKKFDKIKYIGYVEEKHKPSIIKLAKVLAYPSFYEGFGFQPLEAMSVGTPVVVSNLTSLPEIVASSGLLINPYSIEDMTFALTEALNNNLLRQQLILSGYNRVKAFNWQKTALETLNIINQV